MTVALVLAGGADAGLRGQLAALGVRRVDAADRTGPGLLTVAAAARAAGERVLICAGEGAVSEDMLARLLSEDATAAFTGMSAGISRTIRSRPDPAQVGVVGGALVVDTPDLDALARAAETLAATYAGAAPVGALISELDRRGVTVRVLDAGPNSDGAVAQLIVDPAARDTARWAAGRQLKPAALYGISLGLGLIAAIWFSELAVRAKLLASAALAGSFLAGRAASLLAATGREGRVRPAVAWLGAASGLLTEFGVYAALAVSSGVVGSGVVGSGVVGSGVVGSGVVGRPQSATTVGLDGTFGHALQNTFVASWGGGGQIGMWRLAVAAMAVVAVRQLAGLGYEYTARTPGNLFHRSAMRTLEQAATLPVGERFVVIAITAIFFGPRLTFMLLLGWGVLAAGYVLAGQITRSIRQASTDDELAADELAQDDGPMGDRSAGEDGLARGGGAGLLGYDGLAAYRDDGVVSRWLGRLVQGRLPPLPPVLVGLFVTCVLTGLGLENLPGILVLTPVEAMLLAGLGACHPHDGRLDWLVPALLEAGECVFLAALGFSHRVPAVLVFAVLAGLIMRHLDVAYRARSGRGIPADRFGLGWDGRMLLAGLAAMIGIMPFVYAALSGYLLVLFCWDFLSGWLHPTVGEPA
jgi:hypothetical protein